MGIAVRLRQSATLSARGIGVLTLLIAVGAPAAGAQPGPSEPSGPDPATPTPAKPLVTDDKGFVDSFARCDGSLAAVAVARTQSALVAVCADGGGSYEYRGVRVRDGASLTAPAIPRARGGYVVENDGVQYVISADELVVTEGDDELYREPVILYLQPSTS